MINFLAVRWCRWFHGRPMWPIHGKYICASCLREHPVKWEFSAEKAETRRDSTSLVTEL